MQDELLEKAREAEYEGNAKNARKFYLMLARKCERVGDIVKAHSYEIKADVYDDDDKPMRFINE
tara:strand:+ start:61 stop:252 length:192 start_codon:yes stop_codon:yes gene_type:complete